MRLLSNKSKRGGLYQLINFKNMKTKNKTLLSTIHFKNGNLLSVESVKGLLNNSDISDEELEKIRDGFRYLSEVIVDKYISERYKDFDLSEIPPKILNMTIEECLQIK